MRVDEVNDADGGTDEEAERASDEHAPEAPAHLELEQDILKYGRLKLFQTFCINYMLLLIVELFIKFAQIRGFKVSPAKEEV